MKYEAPYGPPGTIDPNASYINGDPSVGRQGSVPPAAAFENPQREIVNLITNSQQQPTDDDLQQVTRAVRDGKLNYVLDSGPLNSFEVNIVPNLLAYTAGLMLRVLVGHTVTGPTTITVNQLNPTAVRRPDGSALAANDLVAGQIATLVCDGTYFQVMGGVGGGGGTSITEVGIPFVHDTGTANNVIGLYSPPLVDIREGRTVEVKLANNVTGPTNFTPNNFPTHPVAHPDGSPIKAGDGVVNQIWLLAFDSVQWQLLGVYFSGVPAAPAQPAGSGRSLQFKNNNWWTPGSNSWLQRTPAMNTNRQVFTFSMFMKRPNPILIPDVTNAWSSGYQSEMIGLYAGDDSAYRGDCTAFLLTGTPMGNGFMQYWASGFTIIAGEGTAPIGNIVRGTSTYQLLMDSKWHHILWTADGANATIYIDGVNVSQGATGGGNSTVNATRPHAIGSGLSDTGAPYWTNYGSVERYAEITFVDGLSLTWDKFAQNIGGIFVPKPYTGAFGPNGFYLNWQDASAVTSTTLGKDWSGNGNNFQPTNFQTTDVLSDYPVLVSSAGN